MVDDMTALIEAKKNLDRCYESVVNQGDRELASLGADYANEVKFRFRNIAMRGAGE